MKGECLFRMKDYEKALPALVEAMAREASSPQIAVLRQMHAGQAALQLNKCPESIAFLDVVVEKFPDSNYLAEAYFERGRAKQKLNQLEQAVADFKQAAERSRDVVGARAQFMIGEVGFQQKQYEEAVKDFQRVMFRYGADQAPPEVKNWQAKAGYEAGRCSEVLMESAASPSERGANCRREEVLSIRCRNPSGKRDGGGSQEAAGRARQTVTLVETCCQRNFAGGRRTDCQSVQENKDGLAIRPTSNSASCCFAAP